MNIIFSTPSSTHYQLNKPALNYENFMLQLTPISNIYLKNFSRNTKRNIFAIRSDSNHVLPISSNDFTNQLNSTVLAEARYCLERTHGTFYDIFNRICITEMNFLPLTQGLKLEHIVYGNVSCFYKV